MLPHVSVRLEDIEMPHINSNFNMDRFNGQDITPQEAAQILGCDADALASLLPYIKPDKLHYTMTVKEAAQILGCSPQEMRLKIRNGDYEHKFETIISGREIHIIRSSFNRFLTGRN